MLRIKNRNQQHLFDPWQFLSTKRREMLDQNWPGFFRERVLKKLPVDTLSLAFPRKDFGRPTKELYTVLGALALQQYHDLTDQETSQQLSYDIQWHYALDIVEESDEAKYICPKTLWTMRLLATELGIDIELFDIIAKMLADLFEVDCSHQRIDSVHVRSNMARLGRIGIFVKGIERFLVNLKRHFSPLWEMIDPELVQRYQGEKARQCFAGVKPSHSKRVLADVASDLYRLVTQFANHPQVAAMYSYKQLCRIVKEQCEIQSDGTIQLKAPKQIRSDSLQNPSDPDATYSGHKGQGYQVQVMETYTEHDQVKKAPTELNLITHVKVETACQSDSQALIPALEATIEKGLAPKEIQADTLYGSDQNCQEAEQLGATLISPTKGTETRSSVKLSDFQLRSDGHVDVCPAGHQPTLRNKNKERYTQCFEKERCEKCSLSTGCMAKKGVNYFYLHYDARAMRVTRRRQHEQTEVFKQKYRWRAGVEATMSQYDRLTGVKRLRVRGLKAVRFAAVMKALAVNIARAVAARRARECPHSPNIDQSSWSRGLLQLVKEQFKGFGQILSKALAAKRIICVYAHN
jgi:hypothetical protein